MEEKPSKFISKLISTERRLRLAMGSFALSLPLILVVWSLCTGYDVLPSMSHYYFASAMSFPMRTWFVGIPAMGKLKPPPADPWLNWLDKKTGLDKKTVRFGRTVDLLRPWPEMQNTSDGPPPEKKVAGR